jgi:hypothetical protein
VGLSRSLGVVWLPTRTVHNGQVLVAIAFHEKSSKGISQTPHPMPK